MMLFSFISLLSSFLTNKHTGFRNINLALNSDIFFFSTRNRTGPLAEQREKKLVQFLRGRCEFRSIRISCVFSTGQI